MSLTFRMGNCRWLRGVVLSLIKRDAAPPSHVSLSPPSIHNLKPEQLADCDAEEFSPRAILNNIYSKCDVV